MTPDQSSRSAESVVAPATAVADQLLTDEANRNVEGEKRREDPEQSDVAWKSLEPEEGTANHCSTVAPQRPAPVADGWALTCASAGMSPEGRAA